MPQTPEGTRPRGRPHARVARGQAGFLSLARHVARTSSAPC
ncbi:hypothetical protein C7S16_0144 [Burkholderia thailandensis]|uniref:Uncharacterized protein n=1 Tax=Burkholderia thailandensis TaxID=57975 RepID=A0AAW9D116_BURTH|nr:hypothetical protein [Burkholderia thailandensis]MDW9256550.1 hypothetical protein [Burkholderia thailandensis]